jgi:hypothetical protein
MGCLKGKEGIVGRVVGIGVGLTPDWYTERSAHTKKNLVAGLLLGKSLCKWTVKIWLWLGVGIVCVGGGET